MNLSQPRHLGLVLVLLAVIPLSGCGGGSGLGGERNALLQARNTALSNEFIQYLVEPASQGILQETGFEVP